MGAKFLREKTGTQATLLGVAVAALTLGRDYTELSISMGRYSCALVVPVLACSIFLLAAVAFGLLPGETRNVWVRRRAVQAQRLFGRLALAARFTTLLFVIWLAIAHAKA